MKLGSLTALLLASAILIPSIATAGRTIRSDNPGNSCDAFEWGPIHEDPYFVLNGNTDDGRDLASFFQPGTVTTGDQMFVCGPHDPLATVWANDPEQAPNPASKPDPNTGKPTIPALTAKSGVMYEWANTGASPPLNFLLAPDVEVMVWILHSSSRLPAGALELELDNWCGESPYFTDGAQVPPSTTSSITWNGNVYTADCASFTATNSTSATDLVLNSYGVLISYVDASNNLHPFPKAPGWTQSLFTTTTLAVSPNPALAGSPIVFEGAVAALPGASPSTGKLTFYNNGTTVLGSGVIDSAGVASVSTTLGAGVYSVTAAYGGDTTHAASTSVAQTLTVNTP